VHVKCRAAYMFRSHVLQPAPARLNSLQSPFLGSVRPVPVLVTALNMIMSPVINPVAEQTLAVTT